MGDFWASQYRWVLECPDPSFHRPVRDYIATCKNVGLELRDLEEPEISEEGERALHPVVVRQLRKMPYSYVLKFVKARPSFARRS